MGGQPLELQSIEVGHKGTAVNRAHGAYRLARFSGDHHDTEGTRYSLTYLSKRIEAACSALTCSFNTRATSRSPGPHKAATWRAVSS